MISGERNPDSSLKRNIRSRWQLLQPLTPGRNANIVTESQRIMPTRPRGGRQTVYKTAIPGASTMHVLWLLWFRTEFLFNC